MQYGATGGRKRTGAGAKRKQRHQLHQLHIFLMIFYAVCRRVLFYIRLFSGTTPAAVFF